MIDLKPCPFCGTSKMRVELDNPSYNLWAIIHPCYTECVLDGKRIRGWYYGKQSAIKDWNKMAVWVDRLATKNEE